MYLLVLFTICITAVVSMPGDHYVMRSLPFSFDMDMFEGLDDLFGKRAAGSCPVNSGGSSKLSEAEKKGYVAAHNALRKKDGANLPDVTWDETVAAQAQKLADAQSTCQMQHKLMECGKVRLGQNLAWDWSSAKQTGNPDPAHVVQMWYDEKKDYNLGAKKCAAGKVCGHYTQVVWRTSTKIGCAARNCGQERLVVCDYFPPGNWMGKGPHDS